MLKCFEQEELKGRRILVRVDLNVPVENGFVQDSSRLEQILPTLKVLARRGAKLLLLSHFGRPEGRVVPAFSLKPIAGVLEELLEKKVHFIGDCLGSVVETALEGAQEGDIFLLENTRFYSAEEENAPAFAKALAQNADLYINDAFSVAHRSHASVEGVARFLPAYAGLALRAELAALEQVLEHPRFPVLAIVGGMKINSKIALLKNLLEKVNGLVIGGGMANTFLSAQGYSVGRSLYQEEHLEIAQEICRRAEETSCRILLPRDVVLARSATAYASHRHCLINEVAADEMILDIGPISCQNIEQEIKRCRTLLWNGPVGAFEIPPFDTGTLRIARKVAQQTKKGQLVSVAGGGDTVAALNKAGVRHDLSYVSMAGGAFLAWLEGRTLPGIEVLRQH